MNKTLISGLLCAGLLSACASSSSDLKYEFKSDTPKTKTSLEVPPDLTAPTQRDRYPIPQIATQTTATSVASPATGAVVAKTATVERAGTQRWLSVPGKSPAEIWPLLKAFWQDNGFVIQNENPDIGYMETDWAENRAKLGSTVVRGLLETVGLGSVMSTPERDRFRIRIEKTETGTDVFFSHQGMYEIYINEAKEDTRWQPRPTDPEMEAVFLSRFLVRLGVDEADATKAVAQAQISTQARARLDNGAIVLDDSFDRAWRRVGLALEHNGLAITDRDRTLGAYFVKPADDEIQKANANKPGSGVISKLAFWKDNAPAATPVSTNLRVQLTRIGDSQVRIEVRSADNQPATDKGLQTLLQQMVNELK
ncbi:MAG: outer membrane protein assembly factor BamC [Vogesella sp.]|uniref:outer membrane protein assembly factor BamC n=1 Tax=Vogesella sp. TaxID=1904252 RepID=UPI0039189234